MTIDLISVKSDGREVKVGDTQFIMVARDPVSQKASKVHALYLADDEVRVRYIDCNVNLIQLV